MRYMYMYVYVYVHVYVCVHWVCLCVLMCTESCLILFNSLVIFVKKGSCNWTRKLVPRPSLKPMQLDPLQHKLVPQLLRLNPLQQKPLQQKLMPQPLPLNPLQQKLLPQPLRLHPLQHMLLPRQMQHRVMSPRQTLIMCQLQQ